MKTHEVRVHCTSRPVHEIWDEHAYSEIWDSRGLVSAVATTYKLAARATEHIWDRL